MNYHSATKALQGKLTVAIALALAILSPSCKQDNGEIPNISASNTFSVASEKLYREDFSKTLSKALDKSVELRSLLKDEALKEFDNNTDILYHLIKSKEVSPGVTVRQLLLQHWDQDSAEFTKLEESLPLLNIFLPDFSFLGMESSREWDTHSSEVAVALPSGGNATTLFVKGDSVATLEAGEIPAIPTVVVNTNKRVRVRSSARALDGGYTTFSYDFLDPAFANSRGQQSARARLGDLAEAIINDGLRPYQENEDNNYIMVAQRNEDSRYMHIPELQGAFDEAIKRGSLSNPRTDVQRATVYYGNNQAQSNKEINEFLYRFKIAPEALHLISDDANSDPKFKDVNDNWKPFDVVARAEDLFRLTERCWTSGSFIFIFDVHTPLREGKTKVSRTPIIVYPKDLFLIKPKVRERKSFWKYRIEISVRRENLESKWVYPNRNGLKELIRISDSWNLEEQGLTKHIFISEFDPTKTITKSKTISSEFFVQSELSISAKLSETLGLSSSASGKTSKKETRTESISVVYTEIADDLGTIDLSFYDPIFRKVESNGKAELATISNGTVAITVIPCKGNKR